MRAALFEQTYPITQVFGANPAIYARFGLRGHEGVDLGVPCGTILAAPDDGTVSQIGNNPPGYGLFLRLDRLDGSQWTLAHLSRLDVTSGQWVSAGMPVGLTGTTGNSTGCHLHIGLRPPGWDSQNGFAGYIDPMPELQVLYAQVPPPQEEGGLDLAPETATGIVPLVPVSAATLVVALGIGAVWLLSQKKA